MITVTFDAETMTMTMEGHSDVQVCAGVSALFGSLAYSCGKMNEIVEASAVLEDDGNCSVMCKAKEGYEGNISMIYWTILNGVEMIAKKYPDKVKLVVHG